MARLLHEPAMRSIQAIPLVRVAVLRPVLRCLARRGVPASRLERYAERAAISASILDHPEALLPLRQVIAFLREAAAGEDMSDLGLVAGQEAVLDDLGVFGSVVYRSPTLGQALVSLISLSIAFNSGEQWWIEFGEGEARLRHRYVLSPMPGDEHAEQYAVALVLNLARSFAGPTWVPREIHWQTPCTAAVLEHPLFREKTRLAFAQPATIVVVPLELMRRRLPRTLPPDVVPHDVDAWRASRPPADLAGSIREVIAAVMPDVGHPRIERVALSLGTSVRTLQRRLSDGGLRFEHIVQSMRLELAADLLERTDARILDIALDLGYSDHAHFTRAFRTWTGRSPLEYRRYRRVGRAPERPLRIDGVSATPGREPA